MADLAARDSVDKTNGGFCDRCFAELKAGEAFCPDCGAPTGEADPVGTDSAVHAELAQANLLRVRGDLGGTEKALLSILRRYPNDPLAHEMLGDVCAARGEKERAIEWYELAIDLSPTSADNKRKLEELNRQADAQETADTAQTLGLPPETPKAAWWPLAAAAGLLLLAIVVAAWPKGAGPAPLRAEVIAAASESTTPPGTSETSPNPDPASVSTGQSNSLPNTNGGAAEDQRILSALQSRPGGSHVSGVVVDPRTQALTVTFDLGETADAHSLAASLGKEALLASPTSMTITLRGLRNGTLTFAADLPRANAEATDPLINVWPAGPKDTPPVATTGSNEPATPPVDSASTTGNAPATTTSGTTAGAPDPGVKATGK